MHWAETQVFWVVTVCRLVNYLRIYVLLGTSQCVDDHNSCVLHVKAIKATVWNRVLLLKQFKCFEVQLTAVVYGKVRRVAVQIVLRTTYSC
jgi:hypothetical protein